MRHFEQSRAACNDATPTSPYPLCCLCVCVCVCVCCVAAAPTVQLSAQCSPPQQCRRCRCRCRCIASELCSACSAHSSPSHNSYPPPMPQTHTMVRGNTTTWGKGKRRGEERRERRSVGSLSLCLRMRGCWLAGQHTEIERQGSNGEGEQQAYRDEKGETEREEREG